MRVIQCTSCNTINRVKDYSFRRVPWCGKAGCEAALPEPASIKIVRQLYRCRAWIASILFAGTILGYVWVGSHAASGTSQAGQAVAKVDTSETTPTCIAQRHPYHGDHAILSHSARVAPFRITTAAGFDYLVKLESLDHRPEHLSFFIHGGTPFETQVPLGGYTLKYAGGMTWCGDKDLFGKETFAKKGRYVLLFAEEDDGYSGREVTLIAQRNGNFKTDYINPNEF
jgi:hypothetical protein